MKIAFVMVLARYLRFRSNYRTLNGPAAAVRAGAGAAGADPQAAGPGHRADRSSPRCSRCSSSPARSCGTCWRSSGMGAGARAGACGCSRHRTLPGLQATCRTLVKQYQRERVLRDVQRRPAHAAQDTGYQQQQRADRLRLRRHRRQGRRATSPSAAACPRRTTTWSSR